MNENKLCPKCNKKCMVKSPSGCNSSITMDAMKGAVEVEYYVCTNCGYIESYAILEKDEIE